MPMMLGMSLRHSASVLLLLVSRPAIVGAAAVAASDLLKILALTPSTSSASSEGAADESPQLSGREAITLTFSRAVIALGADFGPGELPEALTPFTLSPPVDGRLRWVTTSVARFDPSSDWPPELSLTLALNPGLRSVDGRRISASAQRTWSFTTPHLDMSAGRVRSATAIALTNGTWSASLHPLAPGALEFPPGAELELSFDADVQLELLASALRLRRTGAGPLPASTRVILSPCRYATSRCALATLPASSQLEIGALYEIVLPRRSRFHERAGLTAEEHAVSISGLVPFAFPFRQSSSTFRSRYRRLRLWARHGLAPGVSLSNLQAQMRLTSAIDGSPVRMSLRRRSAAVIEIDAPLEPRLQYSLRVTASDTVRDGFGLPLLSGEFAFSTSPLDSIFLLPAPNGRAPSNLRLSTHRASSPSVAGALRQWPAMLRGDNLCVGYQHRESECWRHGGTAQISTMRAIGASDVYGAIAAIRNGGSSGNSAVPPGTLVSTVTSEGVASRHVVTRHADLHDHMVHSPGLLLHTTLGVGGGSSTRTAVLSAGHLAAVAIAVPATQILVWLVNATSAATVANAEVTLLSTSCYSRCTSRDVRRVAVASTSAEGVASFDANLLPARGESLYLLISGPRSSDAAPELLLLNNVPRPRAAPSPPTVASILTDRGVFKLNDTVRVKGYVRVQDASGRLVVPTSWAASYNLKVRWVASGPMAEMHVDVDRTYGSFDASLRVPTDARYGEHSIALVASRLDGWTSSTMRTLASATVAVADPRPPTVELQASPAAS